MNRKLTQKQFWETWPKVAGRFEVDDCGDLRAEGDVCPIIGVAHELGIADGGWTCNWWDAVSKRSRCDHSWADKIARAADDMPQYADLRTRLLAAMPSAQTSSSN